jgi:hypothetical protein
MAEIVEIAAFVATFVSHLTNITAARGPSVRPSPGTTRRHAAATHRNPSTA